MGDFGPTVNCLGGFGEALNPIGIREVLPTRSCFILDNPTCNAAWTAFKTEASFLLIRFNHVGLLPVIENPWYRRRRRWPK